MKSYRSAMGKNVDMAALVAKNENVRAVGNHPVNARGDTIDSHGRVIKPVTAKVNQSYNKTVGNKSANAVKQAPSKQAQPVKAQVKEELTEAERELEDSFDDDVEVEQIRANELKGKQ